MRRSDSEISSASLASIHSRSAANGSSTSTASSSGCGSSTSGAASDADPALCSPAAGNPPPSMNSVRIADASSTASWADSTTSGARPLRTETSSRSNSARSASIVVRRRRISAIEPSAVARRDCSSSRTRLASRASSSQFSSVRADISEMSGTTTSASGSSAAMGRSLLLSTTSIGSFSSSSSRLSRFRSRKTPWTSSNPRPPGSTPAGSAATACMSRSRTCVGSPLMTVIRECRSSANPPDSSSKRTNLMMILSSAAISPS